MKRTELLGMILILFHGAMLRSLAARHGMDTGSISESNFDEHMVEQMWLECGIDLIAIKEVAENIFLSSTKINPKEELLEKLTVHESLNQSFLECLIKQNFPLQIQEEEFLWNWFSDYLESIFCHLSNSRRYLTSKDSEDSKKKTPRKKKPGSKNSKGKNDNIVAIAVLTATSTAILASILICCFFCCCRKKSRYSGYRRNDEKHLLSLSLSDCSGTSRKSCQSGLLAPPKPLKVDDNQNNVFTETKLSGQTETKPSGQTETKSSSDIETKSSDKLEVNSSTPNEQTNECTETKPPPPPPCPIQKSPPPPPGPPPPKSSGPRPPPRPLYAKPNKQPPLAPKLPGQNSSADDDLNASKTKLKPFFWDKVQANAAQSMVWDRVQAGSFQFNEEMIESLFGYSESKEGKRVLPAKDASPRYVRILDPKKSQNLAISLKAMGVKTEEVCEALVDGNELPSELLQTLLKMAPTAEEELKLRLHSDPSQLVPPEQFIKTLVEIPFAYERMEALLFMASLPEEMSTISDAFQTIDTACKELKASRLFLKLLEAVLKTGNRMNNGTYRGDAQAFKLDTLLKLSDVRGTDGKTTLLHFVVQEIIRTEGIRASRMPKERGSSVSSIDSDDLSDDHSAESKAYFHNLGFEVVSGLSNELENVKKAAGLDADALTHTVASLGERLIHSKEFLKNKMEGTDEESKFLTSLRDFVTHAESNITRLLEEERRIRLLVKSTTDYFHGDSGKDEGLRLFVIVRDFLGMIDKVCREVKVLPKQGSSNRIQRSRETTPAMSPARDPKQLLFPAIKDRRVESSDSDDD